MDIFDTFHINFKTFYLFLWFLDLFKAFSIISESYIKILGKDQIHSMQFHHLYDQLFFLLKNAIGENIYRIFWYWCLTACWAM